MRIAHVCIDPLNGGSIDTVGEAVAAQRLGHESVIVCPWSTIATSEVRVIECGAAAMADPEFWKELACDAAIALNWLRSSQVVAAMKAAGMYVICRGDTDGQVSVRVFPGHFIRILSGRRVGMYERVRSWKHLIGRYVWDWRNEDAELLRTMEFADLSIVETAEARKNLERVLDYHGRADLLGRVSIAPHAVRDRFVNGAVSRDRQKIVVSVGRWEESQKNAPLLRDVISCFIQRAPSTSTRFVIMGQGGEDVFGPLVKEFSQVEYAGAVEREAVRQYLHRAEVILVSSRFEGHPIGPLEGLCCGCTVVGTPIPGIVDMVGNGAFGAVAPSHGAAQLTAALDTELAAWDRGERVPAAIASHWRGIVSHEAVLSQMLRSCPAPQNAAVQA